MAIKMGPKAHVSQLLDRIKRAGEVEFAEQVNRRIQAEFDDNLFTTERAEEWIERLRAKMESLGISLVEEPEPESGPMTARLSKPALTGDKTSEPPPAPGTPAPSYRIKNPDAPASDAQNNLVAKLMTDLRTLGHPDVDRIQTSLNTLIDKGQWNKGRASSWINELIGMVKERKAEKGREAKAAGRKPHPTTKLPEIPTGRYALEYGPAGKLQFFQITQNRGKTFYYAYRLHGSPGSFRKVLLSFKETVSLFEKLNEDPIKHMRRFGYEFTICGRCGAELTDPPSLIAGFGPDCAKLLGVHHAGA